MKLTLKKDFLLELLNFFLLFDNEYKPKTLQASLKNGVGEFEQKAHAATFVSLFLIRLI